MRLQWFVTLTCILVNSCAFACDLPVFRYALEYWSADIYEVTIVHRGQLKAQEQNLLKKFKEASKQSNILIQTVDIARQPRHEVVKIWKGHSKPKLPWIVVQYPRLLRIREPVWTSYFSADAIELLLHSPTRSEIAKRLLNGDSAVWVLVESGIKERDEAAVQLLQRQLKRMEKSLEFPEDYRRYVFDIMGIDLRVTFPIVRVNRKSPKEQVLVQTLLRILGSDGQAKQPIAFPIFGRGRSLCALVGKELNEENVKEVCAFLTANCSCEVKAANPGWDILISADWNDIASEQMAEFTPPPVSVPMPARSESRVSKIAKRTLLLVVLLQVVIVAVTACVVAWRRRKRRL
ncbi:MAG TPA: hypothetical protein EYP10_12225 [Armatimonadetes bacterium]|nr:hypothetical protein [Armatimonadota bacterium]